MPVIDELDSPDAGKWLSPEDKAKLIRELKERLKEIERLNVLGIAVQATQKILRQFFTINIFVRPQLMILRLRWKWFGPTILPEGGGGSGRTARSMLEILEDKPSKEKAGMSRLWTKKRKMRKIISAMEKINDSFAASNTHEHLGNGSGFRCAARAWLYVIYGWKRLGASIPVLFIQYWRALAQWKKKWLICRSRPWHSYARKTREICGGLPHARWIENKMNEINVGLTAIVLSFLEGRFRPTHLFFSIVTDKWGERAILNGASS